MKKHTEKPPIDDLFGRKLSDMSLPPSADSFERLRARMAKDEREPRIVFWRNPALAGYMAAAACLVLVCLFGWLYWPSGNAVKEGSQVAEKGSAKARHTHHRPAQNQQPESINTAEKTPEVSPSDVLTDEASSEQLASIGTTTHTKTNQKEAGQPVSREKLPVVNTTPAKAFEPILAQAKPAEAKSKPTAGNSAEATISALSASETSTIASVAKPVPERVLEVTIAEPETLVAARQKVKTNSDEKPVLADNDKAQKETKGANLWHQIKQIKQGEVFARGDNNESEPSLLGRAYTGLKQSFGKEKSAKQ